MNTRTIKRVIPFGDNPFNICKETGLEPIAVELSGGQFLPPVQTLVATLIFTYGKNAYRVRPPAPTKEREAEASLSFVGVEQTEWSGIKSRRKHRLHSP